MKAHLLPFFVLSLAALLTLSVHGQDAPGAASQDATAFVVNSPDASIEVSVRHENDRVQISIKKDKHHVITLDANGLKFVKTGFDFTQGLSVQSVNKRIIDESYALPSGKVRHYTNKANEMIVSFFNKEKNAMDLIVRAQNDGLAFRYAFKNKTPLRVEAESTSYHIPENSLTWAMDYIWDYENKYTRRSSNALNGKIYHFPFLIETPGKQWILLHEADVIGKSIASSLTGNKGDGRVDITWDYPHPKLSKWMGEWGKIVVAETYDIKAKTDFVTPWRMLIIGNSLGTIVESTMTENLNPPSEVEIADWMTPGVGVFPWWGDHRANSDEKTLRKYIDLAATMGWGVLEFDISLIGTRGDYPGKAWLTTPWIKDVVNYAHGKNIKVYGWDDRSNLDTPEKRNFLFGKYRELGLDGIKIDFVNSSAQLANEFRESCLRDAATHKLMVSFHGEYTPRGERKRFPNLMTQEGVCGSEFYGGGRAPTPEHNTTLPFTRNVVGPMDYTPTAYSASRRKTTYAHETALPFIFESGWTTMCDKPEMYLNSPAVDFLKEIEASWDEIRFIEGYPGEFAVLARRKGDKWVIAGINAGEKRTVRVPLAFIGFEKYHWKLCKDAEKAPHDNVEIVEKATPLAENGNGTLSLAMPENGGFVIIVKKIP
jgi:alpha-glucosidase